MVQEFDTVDEAIAYLKDDISSRAILSKEGAQAVAEPFGVEFEDDDYKPLKHMDRLSDSDDPAMGVSELVVKLVEETTDEEPETPTYVGTGSTARARVEANLPKLEEYHL